MKKVLHYQHEKSDKYWHGETAGCGLMTNWDKNGTAGSYEIKEFNSSNECKKQLRKKQNYQKWGLYYCCSVRY